MLIPSNTQTPSHTSSGRHRHHHHGQQQNFKSVPSSPVSHPNTCAGHRHYHQLQQQQQHQSRYHANAMLAQSMAQSKGKELQKQSLESLVSPFHGQQQQFVYVPPPVSPNPSDATSDAGCCGGRELGLRARRGLSSSYSALDTVSTSSSNELDRTPQV